MSLLSAIDKDSYGTVSSPAQPSPASSRLVVMRMTPIELSGTELRLSTNKLDRALNNCNSLTVIGNRFPGTLTRELQRSGLVTREHCVHNNNHPPRPGPRLVLVLVSRSCNCSQSGIELNLGSDFTIQELVAAFR